MVGALTGTVRHVLLAGGGHAHAVALRRLSEKPAGGSLQLTVVNPATHNMYSGALPGVIAGHWPADAIGVDIRALCEAAGATFRQDALAGIDPDGRKARLASGEAISFDLLSLDIGSLIRPLSIPDPDGLIVPIRPIGDFLTRWETALSDMQSGRAPPVVMVIGAGLAGIEVCLAIRYRLSQDLPQPAKVFLIDAQSSIAATSHPALRKKLHHALQRAGVTCLTETRLESCKSGTVTLSDGQSAEVALIVNCAGSAPHAWIAETGLNTVNGRVEVDECLRSTSHPDIWAAGDTSYFRAHPLEPAGVFAVRAGPVIAENITRFARGEPLSAFHPQSDYLKLVSLGRRRAIAEKFGITLEAGWVWKLKKSIDFSFLRAHDFSARH